MLNKKIFILISLLVFSSMFLSFAFTNVRATGIGEIKNNLGQAAATAGFIDNAADADKTSAAIQTATAKKIGGIIQIFLGLVGAIATLFIIYGGFTWTTAGGNSDKVENAKKYVINASLGLLVSSLAYVIVTFVISLVVG